jgi:hypothetical protein
MSFIDALLQWHRRGHPDMRYVTHVVLAADESSPLTNIAVLDEDDTMILMADVYSWSSGTIEEDCVMISKEAMTQICRTWLAHQAAAPSGTQQEEEKEAC